MVASREIEKKIESIEPAKVFTVGDLGFPPDWWENVRVKLGRMVRDGRLEKAGRGKYFRPKMTVFGNIGPDPDEMVKDLMNDAGSLSGYTTGYTVWNKMGLTTQIPNVIMIGTSRRRDSLKRGCYEIRFITQPNRITPRNIPLLRILDSLKLIKQIPDARIDKSIEILGRYIVNIDEKDRPLLVKLALKYPPRVRALLGAILEAAGDQLQAENLKNTLNPTTSYKIGLTNASALNLKNWNIE